jgi:hypothetical protein
LDGPPGHDAKPRFDVVAGVTDGRILVAVEVDVS